MAVYERTYKRYAGSLTSAGRRFLVIPRYALKDVFASKALLFLFAASFAVPIFFALLIYIRNNSAALALLPPELLDPLAIDARFFSWYLRVQGIFAFVLTLLVGAGLISRDLSDNGLALYLSRPISRWEYLGGKLAVLVILLSLPTWLPGLGLFALQASLAEDGWLASHLHLPLGIFLGALIWILLLALLISSLSAWVKWRPVAAFLLLAFFFAGGFFAVLVNALFRTEWGHLTNPTRLNSIVTATLLGMEAPEGPPAALAALALVLLGAFCVFLLHRKIRAYEVVS